VIEAYLAELRGAKQTKKTRKAITGTELYLRGTSAYLPAPLLEGIKAALCDALDCPELIVHYSYKDKPGQIVQTARYITRATFRDYTWDEYMANELYNFRNIRWWGSWTGEAAWELTQAKDEGADVEGLDVIDSLVSGICPDCGQPLKVLHHDARGHPVHWTRAVDAVYLDVWGAQEIAGTGYYRIPCGGWDTSQLSPEDIIRLQQAQARADAAWRERHALQLAARQYRRNKRPHPDEDELWDDGIDGSDKGSEGLLGRAYRVGLPSQLAARRGDKEVRHG